MSDTLSFTIGNIYFDVPIQMIVFNIHLYSNLTNFLSLLTLIIYDLSLSIGNKSLKSSVPAFTSNS